MKIQEMRSGNLRLSKKMENEPQPNDVEMLFTGSWPQELQSIRSTVEDCELERSCWSVISFDRIEVSSVTYEQALGLISKLNSDGVAGLCIVTDEAAGRLIA